MKRRTFISTTILGALSANQLLAFTPVELTRPDINRWLGQLLNAVKAQQRKRYLLTDTSLKTAYETTKEKWFSSGYGALGSDYFMCRNESLALFPIELQHEVHGQIDFVILVFEKKKNNEWNNVKSLSGFNVEALVESLNIFPTDSDDLAYYILPTQSAPEFTIKGYKTPKGHVCFETRITDNKAIVNAQIIINDKIVWNQKHESKHSLS